MARTRGLKQNFTFVKGWNTEASPLTFPENTAKDLDNVDLGTDGSVSRRLGVDFETNYTTFSSGVAVAALPDTALGFTKWDTVAGVAELSFSVTQVGLDLYFHILVPDGTSGELVGTINFLTHVTNAAKATNSVVATASGRGDLFVCGRYIEPFRVSYNLTTGVLTTEQISIEIRDFEGSPDKSFDTSTRPVTATDDHIYDLLNGGWPLSRINSMCGNTVLSGTPDTTITVSSYTATDDWPSRADIQYLGVRTNPTSAALAFNRNELTEQTFGNTPAPSGHFIVNAFFQDRASASGFPAATNSLITSRPSAIAVYGGRVFWAGVESSTHSGNIYFSQQLTSSDKAGRCYQEQDPTAEEFNDLLATDGGLLPIPNAGQIVALREGPAGVIVFATNGVWYITGRDGGAFSATSFSIQKITDSGCISGESVLLADDVIVYWSRSGIIGLAADEISGRYNATILTKETIQTGYNNLGTLAHKYSRGAYIPEERKCVWLYSTEDAASESLNKHKFNGVLILDIVLGAFYKYSISDLTGVNTPYVAGILAAPTHTASFIDVPVTVGGVNVTVGGVTVTVSDVSISSAVTAPRWTLLTPTDVSNSGTYTMTMGGFTSLAFKDWSSYFTPASGVNYTSYLEAGYEHFSRPEVEKLLPYVTTYMKKGRSIPSGTSGLIVCQAQQFITTESVTDDFLRFGEAVAFSGDSRTMAVGEAHLYQDLSADHGSVNIYTLDGTYQYEATLTPTDPASLGNSDYFGFKVKLSGDGTLCVVGAPYAYSLDGTAFVFKKTGGTWAQVAELRPATTIGSTFAVGMSVDITSDGSTIAVIQSTAASDGDDMIYIYKTSDGGDTWALDQTIAPPADSGSSYSEAVSLSPDGSMLVSGHPFVDRGGFNNAGVVYTYPLTGGSYVYDATLVPSVSEDIGHFGFDTLLVPNRLIVGAAAGSFGAGDPATQAKGAYVFDLSGTTYTEYQHLFITDNTPADQFGWRVAASSDGSIVAVSAINHDAAGNDWSNQGGVFVFRDSGTAFTETDFYTAYYNFPDPTPPSDWALNNGQFGQGLAIDPTGAFIAMGAPDISDFDAPNSYIEQGGVYIECL